MSINANKKFMDAILNRISDFNMISQRKIVDLSELTDIMETATGRAYSIGIVKLLYKFIGAEAQEYCYDNGLKYLISRIKYRDNEKNIHIVEQHTLTSDYSKAPIVNISIEKKRVALQELLISSSSRGDIFPDSSKNIEIEETEIRVNDHCGSIFKTYINLETSSLMLEKYLQYYPISEYEGSEKDLLRLCGCGTRYLEIIYNNDEPIYAQLSDKYKVEMANFDPNSSVDAKIIVGTINNEVDSIVASIHSSIDQYQHIAPVKKLEK